MSLHGAKKQKTKKKKKKNKKRINWCVLINLRPFSICPDDRHNELFSCPAERVSNYINYVGQQIGRLLFSVVFNISFIEKTHC